VLEAPLSRRRDTPSLAPRQPVPRSQSGGETGRTPNAGASNLPSDLSALIRSPWNSVMNQRKVPPHAILNRFASRPSAHPLPTAIRLDRAQGYVPNPPTDIRLRPPSPHPRPSSPIRAETFRIRPRRSTSRAGRRGFVQPGNANNPVRPAPGCLHSFGMLGTSMIPHAISIHALRSRTIPKPKILASSAHERAVKEAML